MDTLELIGRESMTGWQCSSHKHSHPERKHVGKDQRSNPKANTMPSSDARPNVMPLLHHA